MFLGANFKMDIVRVDNFARGAVRIAISLFRSLNFVS
jgi:hypothetical protein